MWRLDICEVWVMGGRWDFFFSKEYGRFFQKVFFFKKNRKTKKKYLFAKMLFFNGREWKTKKEEIFLGKICEGEQ